LPDLIRWLPANDADSGSGFADQGLAAAGQGMLEAGEDSLYRFSAPELKALSHRLDGLLWPRDSASGSEALPVVILEVQMHPNPVFHHRLAAETFRFLQQQPQVRHLRVVVLLAHGRLNLGPMQPAALGRFLTEDVAWVDLEALCRRQDTDPLLALLTIPLRPEPELGSCCQEILALRPELLELILPMLVERFAELSTEQIMVITGIPLDDLRHTRAFQDILEEGRQEGVELGRQEGLEQGREQGREQGIEQGIEQGLEQGLEEGRRREASALALLQLERRCGALASSDRSRIEALSRAQLEELSLALLDFRSTEDLQTWLEALEP
jgi:predicted transposase YdaD